MTFVHLGPLISRLNESLVFPIHTSSKKRALSHSADVVKRRTQKRGTIAVGTFPNVITYTPAELRALARIPGTIFTIVRRAFN